MSMAMSGHAGTARHGHRRNKTRQGQRTHQIGVLSEMKELGLTQPQPVVEDNGEWFKYHPHDAPQPQIGSLHLHVLKTMQIVLSGGDHNLIPPGPTQSHRLPQNGQL